MSGTVSTAIKGRIRTNKTALFIDGRVSYGNIYLVDTKSLLSGTKYLSAPTDRYLAATYSTRSDTSALMAPLTSTES